MVFIIFWRLQGRPPGSLHSASFCPDGLFSWLSQPPASWTIAITHRSLVAGLWWGCLTASTPLPPSLAIPINSDCSADYPQLVIRSTIINRANDAGLCAPYTSTRYMTIPAHFTEYRHGKEKKKDIGMDRLHYQHPYMCSGFPVFLSYPFCYSGQDSAHYD